MKAKTLILGSMFLLLSGMSPSRAVEAGGDAVAGSAGSPQALVDKTGVRGGLCLVIGARDVGLARALASKKRFYVQVLTVDRALAAKLGAEVAAQDCQEREDVGVRQAAFDPAHYDADLFNLIVVEDAGALGSARLADIGPILVPNGCVAFRNAPAGFADEAAGLKMEKLSAPPFGAVFRKPVPPVEWRPQLTRKWSAEPNDHKMGCFTGITSGGGRLFYREWMEVEGERWKDGRSQLFARDAYNGRMLWTQEEPVGWNAGWMADERAPNWNLAADGRGRLFAAMADGRLVCLDAATGQQRFVLLDKGAGGKIEVHGDKYVVACNRVFSAEDGRLLLTLPRLAGPRMQFPLMRGAPYAVEKDSILFCSGEGKTLALHVGRLTDGQVQKLSMEGLPDPEKYSGLIVAGRHLLIFTDRKVSAVDRNSGKVLWNWARPCVDRGDYRYAADGDTLLLLRRPKKNPDNACHLSRLDLATGKAGAEKAVPNLSEGCNMACGAFRGSLGDYWVTAWYWIDKKTFEPTGCGMTGGPCGLNQVPGNGLAMFFVMPSRKNAWINCDACVAPRPPSPPGPAAQVLQRFGGAGSAEPVREGDWPGFRCGGGMGNSVKAMLGDKLVRAWDVRIGLGGRTFGELNGRHIGLTQAALAYGLAIVSDIGGQRIVAVDAANGEIRWIFHIGSRADYTPAIHNGLCLFAARDGWVYCLDARTGALLWKRLAFDSERYIGCCEGLASPHIQAYFDGSNLDQNVRVEGGLGAVCCTLGDKPRQLVFKPETGEPAAGPSGNGPAGGFDKLTASRRLANPPGDLADRLLKGISLPRQFAENYYPKLKDGRAEGQVLAFDDSLAVAFNCGYGERDWRDLKQVGTSLTAVTTDPKKPLWKIESRSMLVEDILLTPQRVYCAVRYQREDRKPELQVLSREDGKVVGAVPFDGFPATFGMSASGDRLYVATQDGRLVCYQAAK